MRTHVAHSFSFAAGGNAEQIQVNGWAATEHGHTWSLGDRSILAIGNVSAPHGYFLEIDWQPFIAYPHLPEQYAVITVSGHRLKPYGIAQGEIAAFYCPPSAMSGNHVTIIFDWPGAARASDHVQTSDSRILAAAFRRLRILPLAEPLPTRRQNSSAAQVSASDGHVVFPTPQGAGRMPLRELMTQFEMLAGNCDFGLALRVLGVEQLSLLRFGGAIPEVAIRGLDGDFEGIGERLSTEIADNPIKEWLVLDAYGLRFHTDQSSETVTEPEILQRQQGHIAFLRRKLLEDLELGEKIFVYADHLRPRPLETALPLFLALNRRGPHRMLWVCPNVGETAPGRADELLPGLARASLGTFDEPLEAGHITVSGWLNVLFNAAAVLNRPR